MFSKLKPGFMKKSIGFCTFLAIFMAVPLFSQRNLELVSQIDYVSLANDVWGYTAPDGTEYALVGLRGGVSIVSLADPAQPAEIQFIPGEQSTWRDLKTWGHFAYVTTDQPGTREGLLVIDLSEVPDEVTWYNWRPVLPNQTDTLHTCHNLYVDEFGFCYLSGCDINNGGPIFLDVFSEPGVPKFVGYSPPVYAHDCFVQNNLLYTAEIYEGQFSVLDISDKSNPVLLATQPTPFAFCHNVWANADGSLLFTTDERANAPTAVYDLSDLENIRLLDEFRPAATLGTGVIPHNTHALGNYQVISHYTDGCVVVDATRPDNVVEAGFYDTSTAFKDGFHGCWGAYPYFPSGLIAATDIENGLFILKPTYKRACYLEGKVTDASNGQPVDKARLTIQSPEANVANTDINGNYKTGQMTAGTFEVAVRAKGYYDAVASATISEGEVTLLDVAMTPLPPHGIQGQVLDKNTKLPVPNAAVLFENEDFTYTTNADEAGRFELPGVLEGNYHVYVGSWGYENLVDDRPFTAATELVYELQPGYEDDFNNDLGWTVANALTEGFWERGIPLGTAANNIQFAPGSDSPDDAGNRAFVTGNSGILVHDDEVSGGATVLSSPTMRLRSLYNRPVLSFDYWFYNAISNFFATDSMTVTLENGKEKVVLDFYATDTSNVQVWTPSLQFDLVEWLEITDEMRLHVRVADDVPQPNVLEGGFDKFKITEGRPNELFVVRDELVKLRTFPNPFLSAFTVEYKVEKSFSELRVEVFSVLGQKLLEIPLDKALGSVQIDLDNAAPGMYLVAFRLDDRLSEAVKVVKF